MNYMIYILIIIWLQCVNEKGLQKERVPSMVKKKVVVALQQGLHARPASQFVKTASSFQSDIQIGKGETLVNAKSIISILTLAVAEGDEVTLLADGSDEEQGIVALESYLLAGQG